MSPFLRTNLTGAIRVGHSFTRQIHFVHLAAWK